MDSNNLSVIVLGAGLGKRMKSKTPKVLHEINGIPMIKKTLYVLQGLNAKETIIVANPKNASLIKAVIGEGYKIAIQKNQLGTADAVKSAMDKMEQCSHIAVVNGDDTAFYKPETIRNVYKKHRFKNSDITFITVTKKNPTGFGRIIRTDGKLQGIVEEKDATGRQKKINEVNNGVYFFKKSWLVKNLSRVKPSNNSKEYYLTSLISIALELSSKISTFKIEDLGEWQPIDTQQQLKAVNKIINKNIHIMGISGAGATAIAGIANSSGFKVSGCDLDPYSSYVKGLENIEIEKGHSKNHLKGQDSLIISPAITIYNKNNKEILAAKARNIPVLTWQKFQGEILQKNKKVIAVAGAYGKSTTTAMISQILIDQNQDPTCEVGAIVLGWKKNYRYGNSNYYICEADEYNNNFLSYKPNIAVILNTSWDHPDYFKKKENLISSYKKFIQNIKKNGFLILDKNIENNLIKNVREDVNVIYIEDFKNIELSIIGSFRKENAQAALTVAKVLGLDEKKTRLSLKNFNGLERRLEFKGNIKGAKIYDDYAVQPATIKATANFLREMYPKKNITLVFEPHTFSRINTFFSKFISVLKEIKVDKIFVTETFAAREKGNGITLSKKIATHIGEKAIFSGSIKNTARLVIKSIKGNDIILSTGAGKINMLYTFMSTQ